MKKSLAERLGRIVDEEQPAVNSQKGEQERCTGCSFSLSHVGAGFWMNLHYHHHQNFGSFYKIVREVKMQLVLKTKQKSTSIY